MASTPEDQRLLGLIQELTSRREYASGDAAFPRSLGRADAVAIAADVQAGVDQGTELRAQAITQAGAELACRPGCAACCDQLVAVFAAEAELIVDWLNAPERATDKAAFLAAYPRWRQRTGDRVERVNATTGAAQTEVIMEQWRGRVRCAFNHDDLCSIYEVRPVLCRTCHAVDTPDLCHPADGKTVEARMLHFVPLEDFLRKTQALHLAMHHALGGRRMEPEVLCVAIHDRLTR